MPHHQRLLVCRAGFVLFCLLPTLVVAGWLVRRHWPSYRAAERDEWQAALSTRLGLDVQIDALAYPAPGTAHLSGVRLADPETGKELAACSLASVQRTESGWLLELSQPQVDSATLPELVAVLHDRMLRRAAADASPVEMRATSLTLRGVRQSQSLASLVLRLQTEAHGPAATIEFVLPGGTSDASPIRLTVARHRSHQPAVTWWQLDTCGEQLPLALLADWLPETRALGNDCRFAGQITASRIGGNWGGQLSGTLHAIDLDTLVTERFGHQLSGLATLHLARATFDEGRLVELAGILEAGRGAISPSLVASAQQHLRLARAADNETLRSEAAIPITRLSIGFHASGNQLVLHSGLSNGPGALVMNNAGPILEAPPGHSVAAVNLLRTLLPDNQYLVPATRQTDALVRLLPVPDFVPATDAPRHTPTRLAPASPQPTAAVRQPQVR